MSDEPTPDDLFADRLAERMHGAADHLDGAGVTRAGIGERLAARPSPLRSRRVLAVAAAVLVVVAGAAVAVGRGDGPEKLRAGDATTTVDPYAEPCGWVPRGKWAGYLAITAEQEAALRAAGEIAPGDEVRLGHAYPLSWRGYRALVGTPGELTPEQLRQLNEMDLTRLVDASWSGTITEEQRQQVRTGVFPTLDWEQADSLIADFGFEAVPLGGFPLGDQIPDFYELEATTSTAVPATTPCPAGAPTTSSTTSTSTTTSEPTTTTGPKVQDVRPPAGWPAQVRDTEMVEGEELWGVYLEVIDGPGLRDDGQGGVEYGEDVMYGLQHELYLEGYELSALPLACDQGAIQGAVAEQLEFPEDLSQVMLLSLYFRTREEAESFVARYDGTTKAVVATTVTCIDQPDPATKTQRP